MPTIVMVWSGGSITARIVCVMSARSLITIVATRVSVISAMIVVALCLAHAKKTRRINMRCHAVWFGVRCANQALENSTYCYGDKVFVDKCEEIEQKYGMYWCNYCGMLHSRARDASLHS